MQAIVEGAGGDMGNSEYISSVNKKQCHVLQTFKIKLVCSSVSTQTCKTQKQN